MYIKRSEATEAVLKEAAAWSLVIRSDRLAYDAMWIFYDYNVYLLFALLSQEGPGKEFLRKFGLDLKLVDRNWFRFFGSPTEKIAQYSSGLPEARKQVATGNTPFRSFGDEEEAIRMGSSTLEPFHLVLNLAKQKIGEALFPSDFYEILSRVLTPSGEINLEVVKTNLQEAKAQQERLVAEDKPLAGEEKRLEKALEETESALEAIREKRGALYRERSRETSIDLLKRCKAEAVPVA